MAAAMSGGGVGSGTVTSIGVPATGRRDRYNTPLVVHDEY